MKLLVLGGQLQGTEITYLAKAAGWEVTVVDKTAAVLASRLCDRFLQADLFTLEAGFFRGYDLVFPALEDLSALLYAQKLAALAGTPMAFDEAAYRLSRSKIQTNRFLRDLGIKIPGLLTDFFEEQGPFAATGSAPQSPCAPQSPSAPLGYIIKPDCKSGSKGLQRFLELSQARAYLRSHSGEGLFGQVFLDGPIYSIEVICDYQRVTPYMVTEVVIGSDYDCHRIVAPAAVTPACQAAIKAIAMRIGQAMQLRGIFDIEFVWHGSEPYVLEIDARMPSQTPIAIYHASGVNFVVETARCFISQATTAAPPPSAERHAILQHVKTITAEKAHVQLIGEGQLCQSAPLTAKVGYFGADIALVGKDRRCDSGYATLIAVGSSYDLTKNKMEKILQGLRDCLCSRQRQQKTSELTVGVAVGD